MIPSSDDTTIDGKVWRYFLKTNKYLGGTTNANISDLVGPDDTPGPVISNFINGSYSPLYVTGGYNTSSSYLSFIGEATANTISSIGDGNLLSGMREIRNFIISNNYDLANTLKSIGESDIGRTTDFDNTGLTKEGSSIYGTAETINWITIREMTLLFSALPENSFDDLGITKTAEVEQFNGDITKINNAIRWASSNNSLTNVNSSYVDNSVKTRSNFTVSPFIALKLGYFIDELKSSLYLKAGCIQLSGHISPINNFYTIQNDSFKKVTPFFAIGLNKNLDENWRIGVELSQSLKTAKNTTITTPYGYTIHGKSTINRTTLSVTLIYRLS
jgi:hypothetical protein